MRRIAYLLGATLLLSGCGVLTKQNLQPTVPTLTHARFVYLANRACRRFERRIKRHKAAPKRGSSPLQQYHRYIRDLALLQHTVIPATDHLLFDLHALTPPPYEAVDYRRLLAALNYEDLVAHNFVQAFDEAKATRVRTLGHRLDRIGRQLDARAAKVGLKTCAKG